MIRAAIYTRVSSEEQARPDKASLTQQREKCERYVQEKGWGVACLYEDAGVSGAKADRPALMRLMADARARNINAVVFLKQDRLGRSVIIIVNTMQELLNLGVTVASVEDGYDTSTPSGRLHMNVLASVAEFEREQIRDRIMAGKIGAAHQRRYGCGWVALGYDNDHGRLVINEEEAALVRRIFEEYAYEGLSHYRLAERLRTEAVPMKTERLAAHGGKEHVTKGWEPAAVERTLKNEAYIGRAYYNKTFFGRCGDNDCRCNRDGGKSIKHTRPESEWIEIDCPRIISDELWKAARRRAKKNKRRAQAGPKDKISSFLLSGLVRCHCGSPIHGFEVNRHDRAKAYKYYICRGQQTYKTPCRRGVINAGRVEQTVLDAIIEAFSDADRVMRACNEYAHQVQSAQEVQGGMIESLRGKVTAAAKEREGYVVLTAKGTITEKEMEKHLKRVAGEVEMWQEEIKRLEDAARQHQDAEKIRQSAVAIGALVPLLVTEEDMTLAQKKELIRDLVERVTIDAENHVAISCTVPGLLDAPVNIPMHQQFGNR